MPPCCILGLALVGTIVFRCPGDDGAPLFTDRPCPDGVEQSIASPSVVPGAALTDVERVQLDAIAAGAREPSRVPHARRSMRERQAACDAARATLASVRDARRRGYRLSDAAALDARERTARMAVETDCGAP